MTASDAKAVHEYIALLAETYDITMKQAGRVFAGEANASVERGYYEEL